MFLILNNCLLLYNTISKIKFQYLTLFFFSIFDQIDKILSKLCLVHLGRKVDNVLKSLLCLVHSAELVERNCTVEANVYFCEIVILFFDIILQIRILNFFIVFNNPIGIGALVIFGFSCLLDLNTKIYTIK